MKKAFRDAYNDELALLYERAAEFAAEYPGIAERLGGLLRENIDPGVAGLLEGTAFLAARVQLKLREEMRGFTDELLEQLLPGLMEPLPAIMLVKAHAPAAATMEDAIRLAAGGYIDARFADADRKVSARFRLAAPLTIWPVAIGRSAYLGTLAEVSALGQDGAPGTQAGLQISLQHEGKAPALLRDLAVDELTFHFAGAMPEASALYEQVFCDLTRVSLRWLDAQGDPVLMRLPPDAVEQIGFGRDERLIPQDARMFDGFAELREAFAFPRKYLGFRLTGLAPFWRRISGDQVQVVLEFSRRDGVLASRLSPRPLVLHASPAINLFEESASHVRPDRKRREYVVTPNSSPSTHYEIIRLTEVQAHYTGSQARVPVLPLYAPHPAGTSPQQALRYSAHRRERRLTEEEIRFGRRCRYLGTETFLSLFEPPQADDRKSVQRLSIRALCSNRHLPEYLPISGSSDDFYLTEDVSIRFACLAGPTPPREQLADLEPDGAQRAAQGDVNWRLISYLALSAFGLDGRDGAEGGARSLRELLSLFADMSDGVTERQIQGIEGMATRPVTRMIRGRDGFHPARGTEVTLSFDEDAYEGSGIALMGAILDRFLAEYAPVNSFTQTVIVSRQRGRIHAWPPRTGSGPLL